MTRGGATDTRLQRAADAAVTGSLDSGRRRVR
jgi:hypothetical protein